MTDEERILSLSEGDAERELLRIYAFGLDAEREDVNA